MTCWYLIYTKPRCEDNVETMLSGAGIAVLNPKIKERKYLRRKPVEAVSPLFPCYVFARFDKLRDYHMVKYTRGVKRVLCNEDGPAEISDKVVEAIISRMEKGIITVKTSFAPGQAVYIRRGPFEGFTAIFEHEMSGMERVSILLKTINMRLVIDRCMVSPC
ncbi:MAG: transcription termination/antitermination NusG family protein [Thermodesulfobacteriota bacterium]|nr:MAG: transcription termination/antitermination NusG family protein [Thermodesulfobacteriota bacterium]